MWVRSVRSAILLIPLLLGCAPHSPAPAGGGRSAADETTVIRPPSGGEMVLIPAGSFRMGDSACGPDSPPHDVSVRSFYLDRFPVTQALYQSVMGVNPSKRKGEAHPVERTQWTDAALFCNRCSEKEGLTPCYDTATWKCDLQADGYRLPTEAEWEYACRAGTQSSFSFGDDPRELPKYAWCKPHSRGQPHPVGERAPNRWGLHDMHGNVWQWCNDYYGESYYVNSPSQDPPGPAEGRLRVLRGGAWNSDADKCRSGYRFKEFPVYSDACFGADSYGFRRARNATPVSAAQRLALPAEPKEEELVKSPSGEAKPPSHTAAPPAAPPSSSGKVDASRLRGTIVFVSDRGASLDVWSMRADGASQTPLTKDEFPDADPRFSPNGEQILYTSLRGGFPEVWLMARDGKEARKITEGSQGQWSPDGKAIVFIRDDQVFLRELASGKERRVTPADWQRCGVPSFRPDGKQIAIASRHLGDIGVFLVELDKPGASQVKTQDPCCTPCWSPDAKRLLFQTVKGHIHELDLASGREEQLTFDADVQHDGRYSPDGTMVVFSRAPGPEGPWQICVLDLQSDNLDIQQITREGSNNLPDWHGAQSP